MNKSIKTLSLALLLCVPGAYSMESLPHDVMKSIFEYVMWLDSESLDNDQKQQISTQSTIHIGSNIIHMMRSVPLPEENKYTHNQNGLWHTIRRNHHFQYVSKNFRDIFWDYFKSHRQFGLQEKDEIIRTLLRMWNQGNFHDTYLTFGPIPPIANIAINIGASLLPILEGSIVTMRKCNPEFVRVIVDTGNNNVINQINSWGATPLLNAIVHNYKDSHFKIVKLLLTHPNIQVNPMRGQRCPLFLATYHREIKTIKLLLAHSDIQINAIDSYYKGETALFAAVRASSWPSITTFRYVIDLLISAGADAAIKNNEGQTALDIARKYTFYADKAEVLEQALAMKKES